MCAVSVFLYLRFTRPPSSVCLPSLSSRATRRCLQLPIVADYAEHLMVIIWNTISWRVHKHSSLRLAVKLVLDAAVAATAAAHLPNKYIRLKRALIVCMWVRAIWISLNSKILIHRRAHKADTYLQLLYKPTHLWCNAYCWLIIITLQHLGRTIFSAKSSA